MSLFLEMASNMEGSSQLIDNGVLSNITTGAFINAQYVYGLPRGEKMASTAFHLPLTD